MSKCVSSRITRFPGKLHDVIQLTISFLLVIGPTLAIANEATPVTSEAPAIKLLQVDERIFLGVMPTKSHLLEAQADFDVVIDLRFPYEGVYDELGSLRNIGVQQINIPTSSNAPGYKNVILLESEIAGHPDQKILIHDSNGHRSAMLWAAHVVHSGGDLEEVLLQVAPFLEPAELRPKLERYLSGLPAETVKTQR